MEAAHRGVSRASWDRREDKEPDPKTKPVGVESSILGHLGRGERIRTSGLYVPNAALYQAKLRLDKVNPTMAIRLIFMCIFVIYICD